MGNRGPKAESFWGTHGVDIGTLFLCRPETGESAAPISSDGVSFPKSSHNCRRPCSPGGPGSPKSLHFVEPKVLQILAIRRFPVHLLKTV